MMDKQLLNPLKLAGFDRKKSGGGGSKPSCGVLVMMVSWFYKDLSSDTRRVPRWGFQIFSAYRGGFRESNPRDACRAPQQFLLLGHRVPRWAPEEPNKPILIDLIRSSPLSCLRTIVWTCLNFQVQCVSVS
ncbi:hypothetical protein E3N88_14070 [Mikania micrantha]|uniref:Uncharacterized protein n=1 Tax=Mikania micrantha TaxID=192012 RepID=A0A5N6P0C6_9ASTR|nr:hypothetical protein E3N88_14070 [Mikania micrantha]